MKKSTIASAAKTTGRGLWTGLTVLADVTTNTRIREIDEQIEKLQEERARLTDSLINKPSK